MDDAAQSRITLNGTTDSYGFDCAREGETVTLSGTNLDGVNNNGAALLKNEAGNYYLIVPKGGGIYLCLPVKTAPAAEVSRIAGSDDEAGNMLRIFPNKHFTLYFSDGSKLRGDADVKDGKVVLLLADGTVIEPTVTDEGVFVYTIPVEGLGELSFAFAAEKIANLIDAMG